MAGALKIWDGSSWVVVGGAGADGEPGASPQASGTQFGIWNSQSESTLFTRNSRQVSDSAIDTTSEWGIYFGGGSTAGAKIGGGDYRSSIAVGDNLTVDIDGTEYSGVVYYTFFNNFSGANFTEFQMTGVTFGLSQYNWMTTGTTMTVKSAGPANAIASGIYRAISATQLEYSVTDNEGNTKGGLTVGEYYHVFTSSSITSSTNPGAIVGALIKVSAVSDTGTGATAAKRVTFVQKLGPSYSAQADLNTEVAIYALGDLGGADSGELEVIDGKLILVPKTAGFNVKSVVVNSGTPTGSEVDIAGSSLTITPFSVDKKIKLEFSGGYWDGSSNLDGRYIYIYRGNTKIATWQAVTNSTHTGQNRLSISFMFVDSPNSTSAQTYKLRWNASATNMTINTTYPLSFVATEI